MRNPPRTLQNSIFEPLYSHPEELHFQPNMPNTQFSSSSSSDNWLSLNPPFSLTDTTKYAHTHGFPATCDLGMCSPSGSSSAICPPIRSHSASDVGNPDDGSVASKLLSSITKSISSPSLLSCCKESARETPYQKSLRLKTMKLQYCAEELGSESSEGSLHGGDYFFNNNIFDGLNKMSSSQSTRDFSAEYHKSEGNSAKLISVRSSPNLGCSSLIVSKPTSHNKERSFPPPLSHTLPRSTSLDSFSYSLRASREDGRFVLKEFKVPCQQYFQASRKDGRLTLQRLISTDEDSESMPTTDEAHINYQCRDVQEDDNVGVYAEVSGDVGALDKVEVESAKGGSTDKVEVESAKSTVNLVGGLEVCTRMKGSKKSVDDTDEKNNMKEAECLLMAKLSSNGDSCSAELNDKANFMSLGAANSSKMKSDFKAARHKNTSKASCIRLSSNRQSLLHLPGKSRPNLKPGYDSDATKFAQCAENLCSESKSTSRISTRWGKTLQGIDTPPASLQTSIGGYGSGKSPSTTIIFKDHESAKCLMENVSKLVASCGLEYGGKWSWEEERRLDKSSYKSSSGIMESLTMGKGIKSINMGVREIRSGCSHELIHGVLFDVKSCERGFVRCGACREGECDVADDSTRSCLSESSLHFGVEIPPSASIDISRGALPLPVLQGMEWPHTLHCKEIFHRNFAKGAFMKLHCVA